MENKMTPPELEFTEGELVGLPLGKVMPEYEQIRIVWDRKQAADFLNRLLAEKLAKCRVVKCYMPPGHPGMEIAEWTEDSGLRRYSLPTHTAYLVGIKEIEK